MTTVYVRDHHFVDHHFVELEPGSGVCRVCAIERLRAGVAAADALLSRWLDGAEPARRGHVVASVGPMRGELYAAFADIVIDGRTFAVEIREKS